MNAEFRRVKELFLAALEKEDAGQRAAYLTGACGGDDGLRRPVEALLRRHELAGRFLETPAAPPGASAGPKPAENPAEMTTAAAAQGPGTVIGPYKLLQQIGEGGMGTVWMAEQTEPV